MKTVFVGLSGGVDSAVSAYLLKKEGYHVVGAFIKAWEPDFLPCTGVRDRLEAMRVAAHLDIPFVTYDLEEEYKRDVVDFFIAEYRAGRTPNPDVLCNRAIKFGAFWEKAKADGADAIATGHYAKLCEIRISHNLALFRGTDESKDQTYFLWTLTQDDLAHALFPVGGLVKSEVRTIAERAGLPNASRKDSQGLCFLGHVDMKEFLSRYIPLSRGVVVDPEGKRFGEHDGVAFYTIGERFPLEGTERVYVVGKNIEKNELVLSSKYKEVRPPYIFLERVNWIREEPIPEKTYGVQVRYHGKMYECKLKVESAKWKVEFKDPVLAAEGQSLVVYDPESGECMGGGIIGECRM